MQDTRNSGKRGWRVFLLIAGLAVLANAFALRAGFYMDDAGFITGTQPLKSWYSIEEGDWWNAPTVQKVPAFLYAKIHAMFGASPMAFHALNLLLHVLIACLILPMARALFRELGLFDEDGVRGKAALFAALVFACHPLCTEAVHYTRCSMIQLVTLFSVGAAWATLSFIRRPGVLPAVCAVMCVVLATFSKGPGLVHAMTNVGLLLLLVVAARKGIEWTRGRKLAAVGGAVVAGVAMWPMLGFYLRRFEKKVEMSDTFMDHVLTQGRVFFLYLQRVVAPVNLGSDHHLTMSNANDTAAIGLTVAVLVFALLAFGAIWFRRWRAIGVLLSLALAPLLVRFLYENGEILVEYRAYPAMPWFAAMIGLFLVFIQQKRPDVGKYAVLLVIVGFSLVSVMRSAVWQHSTVINDQVVSQYPLNNRARTQMQYYHYTKGEYEEVFRLQKDISAAHAAVLAFNAGNRESRGRYYDDWRARRNYFNGEQFVTFALAEVAEVDTAIEYANRLIEKHFKGDLSNITEEDLKESAMGSLFMVRSELAKHAEDYREVKRKRGDLRVDGAMPEPPE